MEKTVTERKSWEEFKGDIERIRKPVLEWARNNFNASAEIKSILSIQNEVKDDLEVYLLATDTLDRFWLARLLRGNRWVQEQRKCYKCCINKGD